MGKQRVYEVAKDLGCESKRLLGHLRSQGVQVSSASSVLDPAVIRQLKDLGGDRLGKIRVVPTEQPPRPVPTPPAGWWDWDDDRPSERWWVGPETLTAFEAGRSVGVTPAAVRQWVARGHLKPVGRRGRANLFNAHEVIALEKVTRARVRQPIQAYLENKHLVVESRGNTSANLNDLLTTAEAAFAAAVSPATVRSWVSRGLLRPASKRGRSNLFVRAEVIRLARRPSYRPKRKPKNHLT